jgi:type IV secretory pathway ATPase VirB11/archaellum biosynthesis ATPase
VVALTRVLEKHTTGYGVLADLFADDRVSDVYATAPVGDTPLRVVLDGCDVPTNVRLTPEGAESLASRLRRESGRAFSRASPTLDASATLPSGRVRVAGVTDPVSDGVAFAFRDGGREAWTLPALVDNDTVPPDAAALLSLAVERDAALLVAGSRGAGKTTLLGALLWELPPSTRTLVVEDTPELPVDRLRSEGRDVQALRTATRRQDGPGIGPAEALRTGLRMGESALVVGEVRGEEAGVLYEAMRVGAGDDAVLGTIHGDGAASVEERVTTDLGVPASSFAATDLVVTVARVETPDGTGRRLRSVEEVVPTADGGRFAPLYELDGPRAVSTGRIERGDSHVAASLTRPDGGYGDFLESLERRSEAIRRRVERGLLGPGDGSRGGSE